MINPDFEAEMKLPEWLQMGEQQSLNVNPLVDALKKRMTKPQSSTPSYSDMLSGSVQKGKMQSL